HPTAGTWGITDEYCRTNVPGSYQSTQQAVTCVTTPRQRSSAAQFRNQLPERLPELSGGRKPQALRLCLLQYLRQVIPRAAVVVLQIVEPRSLSHHGRQPVIPRRSR